MTEKSVSIEEIRLKCLDFATRCDSDPRPDNVIATAKKFEKYVTEKPKTRKKPPQK